VALARRYALIGMVALHCRRHVRLFHRDRCHRDWCRGRRRRYGCCCRSAGAGRAVDGVEQSLRDARVEVAIELVEDPADEHVLADAAANHSLYLESLDQPQRNRVGAALAGAAAQLRSQLLGQRQVDGWSRSLASYLPVLEMWLEGWSTRRMELRNTRERCDDRAERGKSGRYASRWRSTADDACPSRRRTHKER
jgi:hypothetical protein